MRACALVAAGALVATAGTAPATAAPGENFVASAAQAALDAVDATLGADADIAALRARDRGYDFTQMLEGIGGEEAVLAVDGTITDDAGPVDPAGPPEGVLVEAGEAKVEDAMASAARQLAATEGFDTPKKLNDLAVFVFLINLMRAGYSVEQIVFDGLIAGGIDWEPLNPPGILEDVVRDGKRVTRRVRPAAEEDVEPAIDGIVTAMARIVEGNDPVDPDFKAVYKAELEGTITTPEGAIGTVTATGRLGTTPDGRCCLGRVRGTLVAPPKLCDGETAPITITYPGFSTGHVRKVVVLDQAWSVSDKARNTGGGSDPDGLGCFSVNEAPELIEIIGSSEIVGKMRGNVEREGGELRSTGGAGALVLTLTEL